MCNEFNQKIEKVKKVLELINEACEVAAESDPDQERLIDFNKISMQDAVCTKPG